MSAMKIPTVTTARLVLRPFAEEDVDSLHRILSDEEVLRYFPPSAPPTRERVGKFIAAQLRHWEEHGFGWWAVEPRSKQELMGWNGLQYLPETEEIEVAFLLGRAYWGRGFATEGARASLRFGFVELGLKSVVALVHPENRASIRVIEKLGLSLDARAQYFGMEVCRYRVEASSFREREAEEWSGPLLLSTGDG